MKEPDRGILNWNSFGLLPTKIPLITIGRDNLSRGQSLKVQRPPRHRQPTKKKKIKEKERIRRGTDDKRESLMIKREMKINVIP